MLTLSDQQLFDIAEYLDSGMRCFFHKKTGEIKTIIDPNNGYGEEEDPIQQEIEENWGDYQKQRFIAYIKKQINDHYLALELKTGSFIL